MNKEFDPYNFDFKSYITEMYNLVEMPLRLPHNTPFRMDDYVTNNYEGLQIEKHGNFLGNWENYRLFTEKENNIETYYLLDKNQPHICACHSFERITSPIKGIENKELWNGKYNKGLVRYWFNKEIIPKEAIIISDKIQSDMGFNFWTSLFNDYVKTNDSHSMLVIDYNNGNVIKNITNKDEMKEFYSDNKFNFRFILKRK